MPRYELTRYASGDQPSLELTREEYDGILAAKRSVLEHLALEHLFDLMLGNYEELERELLAITLTHATYFGAVEHWNDSIDTIQLVARRFANLFTATQGYCDQVPHSISSLYGTKSTELEAVRGYLHHEHSTVLGYRVCTELRGYMQHRGSAVHMFSSRRTWVDRPDGRRVHVFSFAPQVNVRRLQEDTKFKRSVMAELETGGRTTTTGDRFHDLRPFVREYTSALGRVHLKVRELIAKDVAASDAVIANAVERFLALPGADGPLGLAAMELGDGALVEGGVPTFVMLEPVERRRLLERRNRLPIHFDTQVITNEVEPPKA